MILSRRHCRIASGVVASGWSFLVIGTTIYITAVVSYNCSGLEENDTTGLDKIPEVCNAVAGVLPGVGLVLQTGPSVLAPLVARTRADGDRIAAIHMIPPIAITLLYDTPILHGSGRGLSVIMIMAVVGHLFLWQTKGYLPSVGGGDGTNNASNNRRLCRRRHHCRNINRPSLCGAVDGCKRRRRAILCAVSEVTSGEQDTRLQFVNRCKQETESMNAELESTKAENELLRRKLRRARDELLQKTRQRNYRNSLYESQQKMVDSQTGLLTEQGNLTLTLKNELQRTRSSLKQQHQVDQEANQAEAKYLQVEISSLRRSTDGASESNHTEHHRAITEPQPASDVTDKSAEVKKGVSETSPRQGWQRVWEESVFFAPQYLSVMDGSNVCLAPGMGNVTANDGSAATVACTVSPSGSGGSGPANPSVITHSAATVSGASNNKATIMSPPPSTKTLARKAKRIKHKRKKQMAAMECALSRMPDGAPDVASQQDRLLTIPPSDKIVGVS